MKKGLVSFLLCFAMCLSLVSAADFAANAEGEEDMYTITVTDDGKGSVLCDYEQAKYGTRVTVIARAYFGYRFKNWGVTDGVVLSDHNSGKTYFSMPAKNVSISAYFEKDPYQITSISINGIPDPEDGEKAASGKLSAPAGAHYTATYGTWTDASTGSAVTRFDGGGKYSANIRFTAGQGYYIGNVSELKVTVNGKTATLVDSDNGVDGDPLTGTHKWVVYSVSLDCAVDAANHAVKVNDGIASLDGTRADVISKAKKGATVTIIADEKDKIHVFEKWEVVSGNVSLSSFTSSTATFVMPDGNVEISAVYKTTCEHENTEVRNIRAATCVEEGYTGDIYCKRCGTKLSEGVNTEKAEHTPGEWIIDKAADVGVEGLKHRECSVCHESVATETIPALDKACEHDRTELKNVKTSTCIEEGYTGDKYCAECGKLLEKGKKTGKTAHKASEWIIDKAATDSAAGSKHTECTVCRATLETEIIPILEKTCAHRFTELRNVKLASCTEKGYTGDRYCTECGKKLVSGTETTKTSHVIGPWIVDTPADVGSEGFQHRECINCHTVLDTKVLAALEEPCEHKSTEIRNTKTATCIGEGYTGDTYCRSCGKLVSEGETIPLADHKFWYGKCNVCGAEDPNYKPVDYDDPSYSEVDEENSRRAQKAAIVLLGCGVLFAAAAGIVIAVKKKRRF